MVEEHSNAAGVRIESAATSCDAVAAGGEELMPEGERPATIIAAAAAETPTIIADRDNSESPKPGCSSQQDEGSIKKEDECETSSSPRSPARAGGLVGNPAAIARRLKQENERLQAEVTRLRRLVISGAAAGSRRSNNGGKPECTSSGDERNDIEIELELAREAVRALKADRKRLRAEKFDLLNQMKQLYGTLEDKERELRDFIRNYEQRVRESDASLQQLSTEREERERERWSLLRHARDEAERSLSLAAQLNAKELQLRQAQEQLRDTRRQLGCSLSDQERGASSSCVTTPLPAGDRGSCSADSGVVRGSETTSVGGGNLSDSTTEGTPTITVDAGGNPVDADSVSMVSSIAPPPPLLYKDCSPTLSPLNAPGPLSRSVEQLSSPAESEPAPLSRRSKTPGRGRGGTWGSISRVFARSRHRAHKHEALAAVAAAASDDAAYRSWSPLTEEGYAEKLRLLREASSIPMERWRAPTVLAWIEIALGMPQYGPRCAENIKSGKLAGMNGQVLLELSDLELEVGLGISHPMHRKKLRLAIEEHRHPSLVRYPCMSQLGHTWVSSEWLPDLGLAQYSETFAANMVDARMLEHLSKKELEKFLGVTRKFHQASIVHGIHLLRIVKYDRQALAVRRHQCETIDADPLVWSNQRFVRWARNIDLAEYADNLKDSGVHGGLVVLEPSFNGDTMATALGIPSSKNIIRRHLTAELEALVLPARSSLSYVARVQGRSRVSAGSLGRTFSSGPCDNASGNSSSGTASARSSLRGSLSRALGLSKSKSERDKQSPTSSSESSSVISRMSPTLSYNYSELESPIYATPYSLRHSAGYVISNSAGADYKKDYLENIIDKRNQDYGSDGSGLARRHRRVRSIGEIDSIPISPA